MNEKTIYMAILCGAVFIVGYSVGQKKAREQKAADDAVAASDPMAWFANYGGMWKVTA